MSELLARPADGEARDTAWMELALDEAREAALQGEVPVGAVIVLEGRLLARARNRTRELCDPTAHAEVLAIRAACAALGLPRLVGAQVYATLEPCFLCAGALSHARVARLVYATRDPKFGACASLANVLSDPRLNHRAQVEEGVGARASAELLQQFFRARRGSGAANADPGAADDRDGRP
jgi:tRNA(adenine34) deaminase